MRFSAEGSPRRSLGLSPLSLARQRPLAAELVALRERLEKLRAENDLLRARLERIDPHACPHYRPSERLHILLHRARYGLLIEGTARAFVITGQTVVNWLKEIGSGVVARLVQARKPMNALPDLVREIAFFIKRPHRGGGRLEPARPRPSLGCFGRGHTPTPNGREGNLDVCRTSSGAGLWSAGAFKLALGRTLGSSSSDQHSNDSYED